MLNWQYFLFSFIICVSGAILYLRYTEPTYKLSARMLIKDERKQNSNASQLLSNMMDMGIVTNSSGIDNEVEVMQSRILMRDVVRELHLNADFRIKGHIMDKIVYRKQAVNVELDPVVLDSLDKDYMEWGEISSIQMEITRKKDGYLVEGKSYHPGYEKKNQIQLFQENIDSHRESRLANRCYAVRNSHRGHATAIIKSIIDNRCHTVGISIVFYNFWDNYIAIILVGIRRKIRSSITDGQLCIVIGPNIVDGHTICISNLNVMSESLYSKHTHKHGEQNCNKRLFLHNCYSLSY